jgi:glycosyltransferase involved in cell wall biosynthesis
MNIVIVGTAFPLRGGIAHFNALLARELGKRHHVETITFKRQYPKIFFPGKTQDEKGEPDATVPAPQLVDSINPFNWIRVARHISRMRPDLLIFKYWMPFFGPCFGTIARLVRKRTGARVLFICDNVIPHERRFGDVALTRYAFRHADFFIVQSDAVEKDLKNYFPQAIYRNVPHPVYENFGHSLPKQEARNLLGISAENVILYFGYVRPYKGLMVLLEAIGLMRDRVTAKGSGSVPYLLAVGEFYDDETKYRKRVAELNIGEYVRSVSDYVSNNEVAAYFSAADAVILPYLSATQSGITQIAYNFDKPVIATNVGGLAEVVLDRKTGYIVPPDDPQALADAIMRFYDEHKEAEFSAAVKLEKQKYSWEHLTRAIEEMYAGK